MVSFTPEGGPQTMERRASVGASDATAMKRDSATSAKSESNSFSSSNGDGFAKRVGPIDSSPVADPPVKRVKLSETLSRPASDAQLASTLFKKFVNSALDEKAMVCLLLIRHRCCRCGRKGSLAECVSGE